MNNETIQDAVDDIATTLRANGTQIGSHNAYDDLQSLITQLNRLGFSIAAPVAWNSDITQAPTPGW